VRRQGNAGLSGGKKHGAPNTGISFFACTAIISHLKLINLIKPSNHARNPGEIPRKILFGENYQKFSKLITKSFFT
jgi:hypothetical protein